MKKRAFCLLSICLLMVPIFQGLSGKAEGNIDIARLTQEAPGLYSYPDAKGVVWYREINYSMTADGKMRRDSTWVILASKGLDEKWRNWQFRPGVDGSVRITESALYDPGTSGMLAPVIPETRKYGNTEVTSVRFPEIKDEYLILLSSNETISKGLRLDDFVPMVLDIPMWESRINVVIPESSNLSYLCEGMDPPVVEKLKNGTKRYTWKSFNLPSSGERSLDVKEEPFLSFSLRQGKDNFARDAQVIMSASPSGMPPEVSSMVQEANKVDGGTDIIRYVEKAPLLTGHKDYYVRESIPDNPPWSHFEKILLLSKWLEKTGWSTDVYWLAKGELNENTPHTMGFMSTPLLKLTAPGRSAVFYKLGCGYPDTEVPSLLWGHSVYHYENNDLVESELPKGGVTDHKLSVLWNLNLAEDGTLSGQLRLLVRNGWQGILLDENMVSAESINKMLDELDIKGYDPETIKISPIKCGFMVSVPVSFNSAIISMDNFLLKFPSFELVPLLKVADRKPPFDLRFPFLADLSFEITYPKGFDIVALPAVSDRDFGKIRLSEELFVNHRKRKLSGSVKLVVNTDKIDNAMYRPLLDALRNWAMWTEKTIPLHNNK